MTQHSESRPTAPEEPRTSLLAPLDGRRATLHDVAQAAGVSVSAVSKVVRGAYGVSPQMQTRVSAAIDALGYRPNAGARAMRGRSYTIGVVLNDLTSPFQPEVATGIHDELDDGPYQDVIVTCGATSHHQQRSIEALLDRQVDGLVLVAPWIEAAWIEKIAETVPIVAIALHGPATNFDTVVHDHQVGTQLVVDHLVAAGHRKILHTSMRPADIGEGFMLSHTVTRHCYEQAMRRHQLTPDIIETWYDEEGGYQATKQAFTRRADQRPTAIFAGADIAALGVLRAAEELGLRVPEDLSVVGYDNIYISTINRISLTTVDQSGHSTGQSSTRLLLERIDGRTTPKQYVLAPRLVIRSTSGPAHGIEPPPGHPVAADSSAPASKTSTPTKPEDSSNPNAPPAAPAGTPPTTSTDFDGSATSSPPDSTSPGSARPSTSKHKQPTSEPNNNSRNRTPGTSHQDTPQPSHSTMHPDGSPRFAGEEPPAGLEPRSEKGSTKLKPARLSDIAPYVISTCPPRRT